VAHLKNGRVREYELDPRSLGFRAPKAGALRGGDAAENARILKAVLQGEGGAPREICVLNAAVALTVAGLARSFEEGVALARLSLDEGRALRALSLLREVSHGRA
jgi:anthranilate phosphoribosyltransferase